MSKQAINLDANNRIYLIGFMGSGKSTVAKLLSKRLGFTCIDLDEEIERAQKKSIKAIFEQEGERAFRALETAALENTASVQSSVIATGGGVVLSDQNRALLNTLGTVIYLQVEAQEALARISDTDSRPMLANTSAPLVATNLLAARKSLYAACADTTINTAKLFPEQVAAIIEENVRIHA